MSTAKPQGAHKGHQHAHHYESAEHEYDSSKQGLWLFLSTEILMFGGLFVGYVYFSSIYPEVFKIGSMFTDWRMGTANTVVLLFSSLTMALGIHYTQMGKNAKAFNMLLITLICGAIFMVIKYFEYTHKIHLGGMPGAWFQLTDAMKAEVAAKGVETIPGNLALYFSFYYMMTGLHGIHVLLGMGLITWVMIRLKRGDFNAHHYTAIEGVGLFWHLVDLVWIYLFPLLYLV
jgi:cytochrome c oxidase subunit III